MANWEELPQDVLELIAGRLAIEDYVALRRVCTSWRSASAKEAYQARLKAPWLMIDVGKQATEFFSPSRGRISIYRGAAPGPEAETLSTPGWILVSNLGRDYCIFNPPSGVSIELPALQKSRRSVEQIRIHRIALSSSTSLSRSYTVMISNHWDLAPPGLAFHRSGEDAWTVVSPAMDLPRSIVLQLIYYNGLFVALDAHNQIMTLNERELRMESRLALGKKFEDRPYLVECSGSLLVVWKIRDKENGPVKKGPVKNIRVFEVDLKKGTQEEVKSLGNASLFLNDNYSFSVEFNAKSCLPGIKPNRIYFTDYRDKRKKSYSMDDGKLRTNFDATSCQNYAAQWFQPDFCTFSR